MKSKTARKIISILVLGVFVLQTLAPSIALADNKALDYDNPNKTGDNPYRVSLKGVISSGLLTNLVGCTGIVDKVAKVTTGFAQSLLTNKTEKASLKGELKGEAQSAVPETPVAGTLQAQKAAQEQAARDKSKAFTENCLKGIAITLAKNQLTAMTKYTMNWVTTGFNGDPLYVRNVDSYVDSLTTRLVQEEVSMFSKVENAKYYPYGRDYARGVVGSYKASRDQYGSLKQDLTAYLTPGKTINDFANDFSAGGENPWNGWLALTQKPQNNPLGFTLSATQNLENKKSETTASTQEELARNGGFFDQKKCVLYASKATATKPKTGGDSCGIKDSQGNCLGTPSSSQSSVTANAKPECLKYETVTPGSVIKAKIDTYVNSPERQIEVADTINDALNALFSALINKFENQGLSGLGSKINNFTNPVSGGFGSNSLVDSLGNTISSTGVFDDTNRNTRVNESFDLTRDLGNKYTQALDSGSWNADTNTPEINPDEGIKYQYYTVSVAGATKLFAGNYNWKVGDKAYYDGTKWSVGVPKHIIEKKGVFQIQKDYMKSITKTVNILPQVIPKLAELDYCIPGPNTNWQNNSQEAHDEYFNYLSGVTATPVTYRIDARDYGCFAVICGVINHDHHVLSIPDFSNYKNIFDDGRNLWPKIEQMEFFYVIKPFRTNWTFGTNTWAVREEDVRAQVDKWTNLATKAYDEYVIKAKERYGLSSPMRTEFTPEGNPNPAYLPMAQAGLDLTKNIATDAEDLPKAIAQAEDNFAQSSGAIYRLGFIKDKVNKIIIAAQNRRKTRRATDGLPAMPQICLDNERVTWVENDVLKQ